MALGEGRRVPTHLPDDVRDYFDGKGKTIGVVLGRYSKQELGSYLDAGGIDDLDAFFEGAPAETVRHSILYAIEAGFTRAYIPEPEKKERRREERAMPAPETRKRLFSRR